MRNVLQTKNEALFTLATAYIKSSLNAHRWISLTKDQESRNRFHIMMSSWLPKAPLIARFMGPTWGPSGPCRSQMGPMLAPWTLLSAHYLSPHPVPREEISKHEGKPVSEVQTPIVNPQSRGEELVMEIVGQDGGGKGRTSRLTVVWNIDEV